MPIELDSPRAKIINFVDVNSLLKFLPLHNGDNILLSDVITQNQIFTLH
jgi:hypothetical protein